MVDESEGILKAGKGMSVDRMREVAGEEKRRREKLEESKSLGGAIRTGMAEEIRKGYSAALQERRLSDNDEYLEFQHLERWANTPFEINLNIPPTFWVLMSEKERRITELRAELIRVANVKREVGHTLKDLAENRELTGFTKAETAALYNVEGVREALERYIELLYDSGPAVTPKKDDKHRLTKIEIVQMEVGGRQMGVEKVVGYSLLGASHREDVEAYRNQVVTKELVDNKFFPKFLEEFKKKGLSEEEAREAAEDEALRAATDAEQIAFNLLYIGNTFESLDSQWEGEWERDAKTGLWEKKEPAAEPRRRLRKPSLMSSECLVVPIKFRMNPLDTLVDRSAREAGRLKEVGSFGVWAQKQIDRALIEGGVVKKDGTPDYGAILDGELGVEVVPGEWDKWWTVEEEDGQKTLFVPDCYPTQLLSSVWEFKKARITDPESGEKKHLMWFLKNKKRIPWEQPEVGGLWNDYRDFVEAAGVIWNYFSGAPIDRTDTTIGAVEFRGPEGAASRKAPWVGVLNKALAEFGRAEDNRLKRWLIYAATQVKSGERLPRIDMINLHKVYLRRTLGDNKPYSLRFIPSQEIFFPWDKPSGLSELSS